MKNRYLFNRIVTAVVVAVVIFILRQFAPAQVGGDYTLAAPAYMPTIHRGFMLNVINPTASPVVVTYPGSFQKTQIIQSWPGRVTQPYNSGGTFTVPANGTYQFEFMLNFTGGTAPGNWTGGPYVGITDEFGITFTVGGVAKPWSINKSATYHARDGTTSLTPSPVSLGSFYAASPPPSGILRVNSATAVSGAIVKIGSVQVWSGNLTAGLQTVLTTSTPATYAAGVSIYVFRNSQQFATSTLTKDSFGNFDVTVEATAPPLGGRLQFNMQDDWTGVVLLRLPLASGAWEVITGINHSPALPVVWDSTHVGMIPLESLQPGGLAVLSDTVTGKLCGSAQLVYDSSGSFNINANSYAPGDPDHDVVRDKKARFNLEVKNFRHGETNVLRLQVQDAGGTFQELGSVHAPGHAGGQLTDHIIEMPNEDGAFSGKAFRWMSGGVVMAEGTTAALTNDLEFGSVGHGFSVYSSGVLQADGTVATPEELPQNPSTTTPPPPTDTNGDGTADNQESTADNTRQESFDDMAAALEKALNSGGPGPGDVAGPAGTINTDKEKTDGAALANSVTGSLKSLVGSLAGAQPGQMPTVGKGNTYTLQVGAHFVELDWAPIMTWVSPIRAVLASLVSFGVALKALQICRSAFI